MAWLHPSPTILVRLVDTGRQEIAGVSHSSVKAASRAWAAFLRHGWGLIHFASRHHGPEWPLVGASSPVLIHGPARETWPLLDWLERFGTARRCWREQSQQVVQLRPPTESDRIEEWSCALSVAGGICPRMNCRVQLKAVQAWQSPMHGNALYICMARLGPTQRLACQFGPMHRPAMQSSQGRLSKKKVGGRSEPRKVAALEALRTRHPTHLLCFTSHLLPHFCRVWPPEATSGCTSLSTQTDKQREVDDSRRRSFGPFVPHPWAGDSKQVAMVGGPNQLSRT